MKIIAKSRGMTNDRSKGAAGWGNAQSRFDDASRFEQADGVSSFHYYRGNVFDSADDRRTAAAWFASEWFASPYFCTDPSASVQEILEAVAARWAIEEPFHDVKEVLGGRDNNRFAMSGRTSTVGT